MRRSFDSAGSPPSLSAVSLDELRASNALSDGLRCQYNDPDNPNSNSFNRTTCFVGFEGAFGPFNNTNDWGQWNATSPDGGRAFTGAGSLHYGFTGAVTAST